jgi:hypothetical protein
MISVNEELMDLTVTRDDLLRLSQYHNKSCISIYIPTHRTGEERLRGHDSLNLKNQIKEIRNKLTELGLTPREIEKLVSPVSELINDTDFWRFQSEGLAVFVSEDVFEKYSVPVKFAEFNYLSSEFYLKQLLPLFNDYGHYYLLTLKKDEVRFYEGNKYGLAELDVKDAVPSRLEDAVGYDYEEKQLQYRTQLGSNKPGTFHGHGEAEAKDKAELLVFFREIDKGIMSKIHDDQDSPLVLCCLDYFYPIYTEANTHKNLFPLHISNNPADFDKRTLHKKAWEILEPFFRQAFIDRKERYLIGIDKGKASANVREIIPAALGGQVDTLFIEKNIDMYGIYDLSTGSISIQEKKNISNVSLINLAAKKVFEQGGAVYLLEKHHLPDISSEINALFRY